MPIIFDTYEEKNNRGLDNDGCEEAFVSMSIDFYLKSLLDFFVAGLLGFKLRWKQRCGCYVKGLDKNLKKTLCRHEGELGLCVSGERI